MIRLLIVLAVIVMILFILRSRSNKSGSFGSSKLYRNLILIVVVAGLLFFLATSGKFLIPQLLNLIKVGLPFLTKLIGI